MHSALNYQARAIQRLLTTVTENGSRRKCEDFSSSLTGGVSIPSFEADRASGTSGQSILTLQFERKLLNQTQVERRSEVNDLRARKGAFI
jgi:hypothetical protein